MPAAHAMHWPCKRVCGLLIARMHASGPLTGPLACAPGHIGSCLVHISLCHWQDHMNLPTAHGVEVWGPRVAGYVQPYIGQHHLEARSHLG